MTKYLLSAPKAVEPQNPLPRRGKTCKAEIPHSRAIQGVGPEQRFPARPSPRRSRTTKRRRGTVITVSLARQNNAVANIAPEANSPSLRNVIARADSFFDSTGAKPATLAECNDGL